LANDANCLKDNFVLFNAMPESRVKALKSLDPTIERLMAGTSTALELSYICWILGVGRTNHGFFATVPIVAYDPLARRDHVLETSSENLNVMSSGLEGTIHPDEFILKRRNSKLVVETSLFKLV
jgi:hypothetical protein